MDQSLLLLLTFKPLYYSFLPLPYSIRTIKKMDLNFTELMFLVGFTRWLNGNKSICQAEDTGLIPGLGRSPGGGNGKPLQYSCLENPHGQRSLMGYSPWGCIELGMT